MADQAAATHTTAEQPATPAKPKPKVFATEAEAVSTTPVDRRIYFIKLLGKKYWVASVSRSEASEAIIDYLKGTIELMDTKSRLAAALRALAKAQATND